MVDLNVRTLVKAKTEPHFKHITITLIPAEETQQYIQQVISLLDTIPKLNPTIIWVNINASIRNRLPKSNSSLDPEEIQIEKIYLVQMETHTNIRKVKK